MTTAGRQGPGICAVRGLLSCHVRLCVIFVIAILVLFIQWVFLVSVERIQRRPFHGNLILPCEADRLCSIILPTFIPNSAPNTSEELAGRKRRELDRLSSENFP
jgi:hypothetical protein